ncbi:hypothetical protein SAY87_008092 [Trapa incisa]|uniref:Calmodulin-binding domain-containing protein n=1 Tax=Trapa incisa TaxID=236973 RepID=A0AAN7KNB3_9MYRT|nr:hypothetical protein SAY87_008092 [Trapa incisa]
MGKSIKSGESESESENLLTNLFGDAAEGSQWPSPIRTTVSPSVNKENGTSSHQKTDDDIQESPGGTRRRSGAKVAKGMVRLPSSKLRRSGIRKGLGGAEQKKRSNNLRAIKLVSRDGSSQRRKSSSSYEHSSSPWKVTVASPNYLKATKSSDVRMLNSQSSISSSSLNPKATRKRPIIAFRRTSTLRPTRFLAKIPSLRPKRPAIRPDSSIHRATCSSAIKDAKFPAQVESQEGGDGSGSISSMKVCPYNYCSLHGHHHAAPSLKRLKSARKCVKSQRIKKLDFRVRKEVKIIERESSHELTEECNSGEDMDLNADEKEGIAEEVDEVALQEKQQQSQTTNPLVVDEESFQPSPTCQESCMKRESGGESVEYIHGDKGIRSGKGKSVSIGVQTEPELEELDSEPSAADTCEEVLEAALTVQESGYEKGPLTCYLSHGHSTSHYVPLDSSKFVDIGKDEPVKAIRTEELASMYEMAEQNLESLGEPKDTPTDSREEPILVSEKINGSQESVEETAVALSGSQKFNGLWYLIYQHMVSDLHENGGMESTVERDNKEEQEMNDKLSTDFDQDPKVEAVDDEASQQEGLQQSDAVKLLQEAITKILEQSQDQLSIRKPASNHVIFNKKERVEDLSTDCERKKDLELKEKMVEAHLVPKAEEQSGVNAEGRPNRLASQRWSNLKKYLLMRRFIKAMEKTTKLGHRIHQYPSSEVSPEHEKVNLRRQPVGERRSAEEWMLDHALQKAVSNLDPAQKRRVSLLVEAFERVNPILVGKTLDSMDASSPSTVNPLASRKTSLFQTEDRAEKEKVSYHKLHIEKMQSPSNKCARNMGQAEVPGEGKAPEVQGEESNSSNLQPQRNNGGRSTKILVDTNITRMQVLEDRVESTEVEFLTTTSQVYDELEDPAAAGNAFEGVVRSTTVVKVMGAVKEVGEALAQKEKNLQDLLAEEHRPISVTDAREELQLEKKKYTGLWFLIYKQMASGLAEEQGDELTDSFVDGSGKEDEEAAENEEDKKKSIANDDSPDALDSMQNMLTSQREDTEEMKLRKIEAVKLVQQAIDSILRECEDSSPHNRLSTGNEVPEQESKEGSCTSCVETSLPSSTDSTKEHKLQLDSEMQIRSHDAAQQEERKALQNANKSKLRPMRNWNNLRKVILLRRFVKALETKVSNFNPLGRRHLPPDHDVEPEKVNLKHQDMDERKSAEEYLLDYALQQVVSRLTPARKRKVHLLVEAFETITPTIST